jgi:hypothetical protein
MNIKDAVISWVSLVSPRNDLWGKCSSGVGYCLFPILTVISDLNSFRPLFQIDWLSVDIESSSVAHTVVMWLNTRVSVNSRASLLLHIHESSLFHFQLAHSEFVLNKILFSNFTHSPFHGQNISTQKTFASKQTNAHTHTHTRESEIEREREEINYILEMVLEEILIGGLIN